MTQVTKESLSARIAELESGTRSIKEDYQLEAYRMLLNVINARPAAYLNATDILNAEEHILARRVKSKACTMPVFSIAYYLDKQNNEEV
ncbi:TPA: hypothetical protein ACLFZF_002273 [Klebsiella aerogenes]